LVNARRDADAAGRNFNRVVGRPAESAIELDTAGMPALENAAVPSRDELLREALNRRKDLAGLKEFRMQMEDLASIYSANYLPTIGLLGKFGFNVTSQQASDVKNIASWEQRDWSVGVGLTWTLFDGFKNAGDAGITRASVRTLEVNEGNLKRAIEIAVDNALRRKMAADSGWAAALEGTAAAREARTLYGQTLSMGGGALSDLLQAEENLRLSELGLLSARLERLNAAAGLALVQGRDLINLPEEP
jgi:outer membrane protein TolC